MQDEKNKAALYADILAGFTNLLLTYENESDIIYIIGKGFLK